MLSVLFRRHVAGAHEVVTVFVGPDREHRALAGTLTVRPDESDGLWQGLLVMQHALREVAIRRARFLAEPEPERWASHEEELEVLVV